MNHTQIIRELILHTKHDFVSYFEGTSYFERAKYIIELVALSEDSRLALLRNEVDQMIPDTNDDGRWECSYALNTGCMILSLIDHDASGNIECYNDAVTMFFDTVDFKVHQNLEKKGLTNPSEEQITSHIAFLQEKEWFDQLVEKMS